MKINKIISALIVFCTYLFVQTNSAKILVVSPTQATSHNIVIQRLLHELAKSGHEITVITQIPTSNWPENYKEIHLDFGDGMDAFAKNFFKDTEINQVIGGLVTKFYLAFTQVNRLILKHPKVQALINSNEKFDLLIFEIFMDEALLGLAHHFNCPVVGFSTIGISRWVQEYTASPMPWSYLPHFALNYPEQMIFTERFMNTITSLYEEYILRFIVHPKMETIYNEVFADPKPNFYDLLHSKISLVLLNNHISLSGAKPIMTNMIEVGGMHVNRNIKPLPERLQKFIDSAEHGVIYFCLGSNVRPKYMHQEKKYALIKILTGLKEKIIWKFDDDTIEFDKNKFFIDKWMPQNDILANPKIKLFITHGGLLGTTEAVVHGVPLLGIPIMADQKANMAKAIISGYGVNLEYTNLTESSLKWALTEVLENPKYKNTMKELSKRFKDRPQDALETAKYWVEYVIRNKGAVYLQSPALKLNVIEQYNLDVYGIIIITIQTLMYILYRLLKCVYNISYKTKRTDIYNNKKND